MSLVWGGLSQKTNIIVLSPEEEMESTFSGDIDQQWTFNQAVTKDNKTDNYKLNGFVTNPEGKIYLLKEVAFKKIPKSIAFHANDSIYSCVVLHDNQISMIDYQLDAGTAKRKKISNLDSGFQMFRDDQSTVMVSYNRRKRRIQVVQLKSTSGVSTYNVVIPERQADEIQDIFSSQPSIIIPSMTYIEGNSANERKAYLYQNKLVYTLDDKKEARTRILTIDLTEDKPKLDLREQQAGVIASVDDFNSYVLANQLYQFQVSEDDFKITVTNLEDNSITKEIRLNDLKDNIEYFKRAQVLAENASRSKYAPTIAVNAGVDGSSILVLNYIDPTSMANNYNYSMSFFNLDPYNNVVTPIRNNQKKKFDYAQPYPVTITIDPDNVLLNNTNATPVYDKLPRKYIRELLLDNDKYEKVSVGFTSQFYSFIYFDDEEQSIKLVVEPL
ncbi:hypothetical protein [Croceiramulus getboli]|nr:hypothetical protein P8624_11775 [Flavobacteriaceae bacterium YJPT1-3]